MNSQRFPLLIQVLCVLAAAAAFIVTSSIVCWLTRGASLHFANIHKALPALPEFTVAMINFGPHALLFGMIGSVVVIVAALLLGRNAPSAESASTRLLLLLTFAWVLNFLILGTLLITMLLPMITVAGPLHPRN